MHNGAGALQSIKSYGVLGTMAFALLLSGCGAGSTAATTTGTTTTTTTTPPVSSTPASPATLTGISPGTIMAGTAGNMVTLQGTNINSNATLLIDGTAHAVDYISSTEMDVPLTSADLAAPSRHAFTVQNPQATISGSEALLVTSGYNAFGDSITFGMDLTSPETQNYTALLAATFKLAETNSAHGGDQACDVFPRQLYTSGTGYTSQPAALQSMMVGTNDVDFRGPGYFEPIFNTCYQAALSWLGTPRESRAMAGDSTLATTGACINSPSAAHFGGVACSGAGTIKTTLTTGGNPIYIWYTLSESLVAASFEVTLDGTSSGTYFMLSAGSINTNNGTHVSVALVRLPASAGPHTVTITTSTGNIGIQGIGSNPVRGTSLPRIVVGDLPNQLLSGPYAPVASQLAYNADIAANVALLAGDGLDLHLAPTRNYMLGTAAEMADPVHPNALGQQHVEAAFLSVMQ